MNKFPLVELRLTLDEYLLLRTGLDCMLAKASMKSITERSALTEREVLKAIRTVASKMTRGFCDAECREDAG